MVNSIFFGKDSNEFEFLETGKFLTTLGNINIFIGSNNSGKSRLIRHCFYNKDLSFIFDEGHQLNKIKTSLNTVVSNLSGVLRQYGIDINSIIPALANINIPKMDNRDFMELFSRLTYTFSNLEENGPIYSSIRSKINNHRNLNILIDNFQKSNNELENALTNNFRRDQTKIARIYIPVLRGLRPLYNSTDNQLRQSTDLYAIRTSKDYFLPKEQTGIFTGYSIYEEAKKLLLGDENDRIKITSFEKFMSEYIFKEPVTLIPKYDDDALHIKIGNSAQRPVYSLGDGIQTIIIAMFPVFMNKDNPQLVFIEEPETHLHPHWQRIFIDALKIFPNHQFFITTHSSTFINLPNASIYEVRNENDKANVRHISLKSEQRSALFNLGYRSSDVLQTNYILWLEGPSDRIYFNYWLKKVDPELEEGIHYSILFSGGENYKHLFNIDNLEAIESIRNICLHYGVCFDSDKTQVDSTINAKKLALCDKVAQSGQFSWITSMREVENYIPHSIYVEAVKKVHRIENIIIDDGGYGDRQKYQQVDAPTTYKQHVRIEDGIWRKIQSNGIDGLKEIKAIDLRKSIANSIKDTASNTSKTDKILVAAEVVKLAPEINDAELSEKITELVRQIKIANHK